MKTSVPFHEGLFKEVSGKKVLVAAKCRQCGQVVFPVRETCLNCQGTDLEKIHLSRQGKLYSYSIVHMPSEHFEPPYAVGWIELPEGIKIFSQVRGWREQALKTEMEMTLFFEKLWDEGEKEVIGYVFRPSESGGA